MQNEISNKDYLGILIQSLNKKIVVLDKILVENAKQSEIIAAEKFDFDKFDEVYAEKENLINELKLLDNGFEKVYNRVKEILDVDRELYKNEIKAMQDLIRIIISKAADVEVSEKRNHEAMTAKNVMLKKQVKTVKLTNKAAAEYYQTMNKLKVVEPQFMDKKK
ncbi:MAG: flagellar protein FliT [Lachnospiraceae bacterium]|nr:flagellar protein FliT [Lachnospiraceae bacterium]